jgi:hypothetical protein
LLRDTEKYCDIDIVLINALNAYKQRVAQFNLQATDRFLEADLSTYPKGLYIAVVHLMDGSTQSVKVIK